MEVTATDENGIADGGHRERVLESLQALPGYSERALNEATAVVLLNDIYSHRARMNRHGQPARRRKVNGQTLDLRNLRYAICGRRINMVARVALAIFNALRNWRMRNG